MKTPLKVAGWMSGGSLLSVILSMACGNMGPCGPADVPAAISFYGGGLCLLFGLGLLVVALIGLLLQRLFRKPRSPHAI